MVRKEEYFKNGSYFECSGCYDGIEIKTCSRCKKEYYATSINFRKRPKLKCGFESACKNCEREYNKNSYNKDYHKEYREYKKEYYQTKNGKERARIATEKRRAKKRGNGGSYTKEQ